MDRILCLLCVTILSHGCSVRPHSLHTLHKEGIKTYSGQQTVTLDSLNGRKFEAVYLGSGGIYLLKDGEGMLIDPFFSHQSVARIGKSVFLGKKGKKTLRVNAAMVGLGLKTIHDASSGSSSVIAILNAHSHYDHLMDIPAVTRELNDKPMLMLNRSGYNTCHLLLDTARVIILEDHMSTPLKASPPVVIPRSKGTVHIYPILSEHNPHFKNVKFFSGAQVKPTHEFADPFARTKANLWLEGNTFSFLIDYIDERGKIDFRVFIQSSSCNAPAGIPPAELREKPVDLAFIGVVSYSFSPGYPCDLLNSVKPKQIVWVHWEDFFRKYSRKPKTVRGTDVAAFFKIPCVLSYKNSGKILWPRVKMELEY